MISAHIAGIPVEETLGFLAPVFGLVILGMRMKIQRLKQKVCKCKGCGSRSCGCTS